MFGYICGGRPVELVTNQVEPTKFVFTVQDASKINYIALFLLPGAQFPPDAAAAVYAQLPNKEEFTLLGALGAQKQSAIFRLNIGAASSATNDVDEMIDDNETPSAVTDQTITFGISIESVAQVDQYISAQRIASQRPSGTITAAQPPPSSNDIATLANKIVSHAYNFLASFIDNQNKVPIKAFDDWWAKFKSRLSTDPGFLKSIEES